MNRFSNRMPVFISWLTVLMVAGFADRTMCAAETTRPNIVFLLCDDLGYGDVGCFGQKRIRTPNVDRLAAEGMRMTVHYCGNAVCAPSRCV
ncbi:MAG TPA: sulfatase-like hydrolase/transferase, partial [Planctomycetaceae bacterium]|nr:sulfatase-like hydrolase/transferase [Planctomycetaceae bacterium]